MSKGGQFDWQNLWEERGRVVRSILGETYPAGAVVPFSWKEHHLPGACSLCFRPSDTRRCYTYMTLGLTQPIELDQPASPWELCVTTNQPAAWPHELLYDLVTYWLTAGEPVSRGLHLPVVFFRDPGRKLHAGLADERAGLDVVGDMTGLYLWDDRQNLRFPVSSGDFHLLAAVTLTEQEDQLAIASTPPHLLLLLEEMGVGQVCDPYRRSVEELPGSVERWSRIRTLSHDEVVRELQRTCRNC